MDDAPSAAVLMQQARARVRGRGGPVARWNLQARVHWIEGQTVHSLAPHVRFEAGRGVLAEAYLAGRSAARNIARLLAAADIVTAVGPYLVLELGGISSLGNLRGKPGVPHLLTDLRRQLRQPCLIRRLRRLEPRHIEPSWNEI